MSPESDSSDSESVEEAAERTTEKKSPQKDEEEPKRAKPSPFVMRRKDVDPTQGVAAGVGLPHVGETDAAGPVPTGNASGIPTVGQAQNGRHGARRPSQRTKEASARCHLLASRRKEPLWTCGQQGVRKQMREQLHQK